MNQRKERRVFSLELRLGAVQRMLAGESPTAIARELGVLRKSLYEWKDTYARHGREGLSRQRGWSAPLPPSKASPVTPPAEQAARAELLRARARIAELEKKVGQQELELDFFGKALQRIKALGDKNASKSSAHSSPINPCKAN